MYIFFIDVAVFIIIISSSSSSILLFGELFTSAFVDGLRLQSEWQQVSQNLKDSSKYSRPS